MPRSRFAVGLDFLALVTLVGVFLIVLTGGVYTQVFGVRLSARGVERPIAVLLGILALRTAIDRRTSPLGLSPAVRRRICARLFRRSGDPDHFAQRHGSARRAAIALVGFCLFGAVLLQPQLRQMDAVPDVGDPLFSIWRMGWVYQQLQGDARPLFDGNIFHPERLTLTYSDSMLLPALTAAPLLALGVHPVAAYNLLFLSAFVLSAVAMYLLVERLTGSPHAAFVSGLIFGFYPYRFEHYSHLELQMTHWMPLALLALHRFATTARIRYAMASALCLVAQLYSSMYYAVFFTVYGAAVFGVLVVFVARRARELIVPGLAAAALAGVLALPLARPYRASHEIKGERDRNAVEMFSADRLDYLRAHQRSALYNARTLPGRQAERALFPGVLPLTLSAVALVPPLGVTRLAYAAGLLVAFDGSLGLNGVLYPYFFEYVLPFKGLRVPARFSILVGLSLAVLAGFGVQRLLRGATRTRAGLATGTLVFLVALDVWPLLTLVPIWREPPPIYGSLAGAPGVVLLEFPLNTDPMGMADNTAFMYFSLWHWSQMVNGYSGYLPPGYSEFVENMIGFPDPRTIALVRSRGVTHVSVNCGLPNRGCGDLLDALSASPAFRVVAETRWRGMPVRLYQLVH